MKDLGTESKIIMSTSQQDIKLVKESMRTLEVAMKRVLTKKVAILLSSLVLILITVNISHRYIEQLRWRTLIEEHAFSFENDIELKTMVYRPIFVSSDGLQATSWGTWHIEEEKMFADDSEKLETIFEILRNVRFRYFFPNQEEHLENILGRNLTPYILSLNFEVTSYVNQEENLIEFLQISILRPNILLLLSLERDDFYGGGFIESRQVFKIHPEDVSLVEDIFTRALLNSESDG